MLAPVPSRTHVALHAVVYNPLQSDKEGENTTRPEGASKNSQEVLRGKWWYSQVQNKVGSFSWRWRCARRANCGDRYRTHRGSFGAHVLHGLRKEWHPHGILWKANNNNFKTNQEILLPLFSILKDLTVLASMRRKPQQKRHGQYGLAHPMVPLHPRRARPPQRPWHPPGSWSALDRSEFWTDPQYLQFSSFLSENHLEWGTWER